MDMTPAQLDIAHEAYIEKRKNDIEMLCIGAWLTAYANNSKKGITIPQLVKLVTPSEDKPQPKRQQTFEEMAAVLKKIAGVK